MGFDRWSEREHISVLRYAGINEPLTIGEAPRLVCDPAGMLAEACSVESQADWEWGFIEHVSTGMANVRESDNDDEATFLEVARRGL